MKSTKVQALDGIWRKYWNIWIENTFACHKYRCAGFVCHFLLLLMLLMTCMMVSGLWLMCITINMDV